jgi:hypothetical protein
MAPAAAAPAAAPKELFPNFIVPPTAKDPARKP